MNANAVSCDCETWESVRGFSDISYQFPVGYHVCIDFNKLAQAVHDAEYRQAVEFEEG